MRIVWPADRLPNPDLGKYIEPSMNTDPESNMYQQFITSPDLYNTSLASLFSYRTVLHKLRIVESRRVERASRLFKFALINVKSWAVLSWGLRSRLSRNDGSMYETIFVFYCQNPIVVIFLLSNFMRFFSRIQFLYVCIIMTYLFVIIFCCCFLSNKFEK